MSDIVERLQKLEAVERELAHECDMPPEGTANWAYAETCKAAADTITALRAENERLRVMIDLYREAVRIDATMEGPKFMGANSSALKRAWDADLAALEGKHD